jgi:hypothetical protein
VLALVIFMLALVPRLPDLGVFVGPDETSWVKRSDSFARALADGDLARTYQSGHPGVTLLWLELPVSWGYRDAPANPAPVEEAEDEENAPSAPMTELATKRTTVALVNAVVVALAALMLRGLFGSGVGWVAGFLLAFDPFLLTESRAVRSEGMVTSFGMLALLALLLVLKRPRPAWAALAGLLTGLALLSKVSAVALLPVGALVTIMAPLGSRRAAQLMSLAAWAGGTVLVIVLLWPALWVAPLDVARQMADYVGLRAVEGGGGSTYSFFMGREVPGTQLGLLFYPVVLMYRSGPWQWLGLLLLALIAWRGLDWSRRTGLSVAVLLCFGATYLALITAAGLKFDRYTVPLMPVFDILAALGLVMTWRWAAHRWSAVGRFSWLAGLVVLVLQVALALPHHPYYYTYYNPLLGGIRNAVRVVPVGTGYEGTDKAAAYVNSLPEPNTIRLATAVSSKLKPLFEGQTIPMANQDGRWFEADYTFIYISQLQRGKHGDEIIAYLQRKPLDYSFQLAGLDYGWVYRGPRAQHYAGDSKLEGRAILHAYDLSATQLSAGQPLTVTTYFRNEGQQAADRLYVRLVDADGYQWAESTSFPRAGFEDAWQTRKAIVEGEAALSLPVGMPPGAYILKMGYTDAVTGHLIGEFALPAEADDVLVQLPSAFPAPGAVKAPNPLHLHVGADLTLVGYQLDSDQVMSGGSAWLTLFWQAQSDVGHDYVLAVRLRDAGGKEIAYWLGRPARSTLPTNGWKAGQVVQDPWLLKVPTGTEPGVYQLEVAVFDTATSPEVAHSRLGALSIVSGEEK